ncbi:hypothetical protein LCGC14_0536090 [marine sediment metagenome]|uniref:SF3 helicase domain-containing protein n=1 Tax=marine sediment metagenome TaxID=412755 RepID=A0A0F9SCK8_9ZZZZ
MSSGQDTPSADFTFAEQFEQYTRNVYPAMLVELAEDLGVSTKALTAIGIGFNPIHQSWISPERDETGEIIGLVERFSSGKKIMAKGSKRGLTYILNPEYEIGEKKYAPGKHNWCHTDGTDFDCPICKGNHYCLVSAENPYDPSAVICGFISEGAEKETGGGWLHIRKETGRIDKNNQAVFKSFDSSILVVEGFTDVATAFDLGFTAIGKPSATAKIKSLAELTQGREVVVIGENDGGVGVTGMEQTFHTLRSSCSLTQRLLPPEGIKDLRKWFQRGGLTHESLLAYIKEHGNDTTPTDVLEDDSPMTIAEAFLADQYSHGKTLTLRNLNKTRWFFKEGRYVEVDDDTLRGQIYAYLRDKTYKKVAAKGEIIYPQFRPDSRMVSYVIDAFSSWTAITGEPPQWLDGHKGPNPQECLVFRNGIIDLKKYFKGEQYFLEPNPRYFCLNAIPYDFDPSSKADDILDYFQRLFNNQQDCIDLLQEWFGYHLSSNTRYEKMLLLRGKKRSGKGTTLKILETMLGTKQITSTDLAMLATDFGYAPLVGKAAAFLPDTNKEGSRGNTNRALEKLLQVIGGDVVDVNAKFKKVRSGVQLTCKFTMAVNLMPEISDSAGALESRLNILSYPNCYADRVDPRLKNQMAKSAHKLIPWALEGLRRLREHDKFTVPESSEKEFELFRDVTNPVLGFMSECCVISGANDDIIPKHILFSIWKGWCNEGGQNPGTNTRFGQRLPSSIGHARPYIGGERVRAYTGLQIKETAKRLYL